MAVYVIADVKVTDDSWLPGYAEIVHEIVHRHGGNYLSRTANVKTIEGQPLDTTVVALVRFPSMEAVQAFAAARTVSWRSSGATITLKGRRSPSE